MTRSEAKQRAKARLWALLAVNALGLCPKCGGDAGGHVCVHAPRKGAS